MNVRWARRLGRAELRGRRLTGVVLFGAVVALASAALVTGLLVEQRAGRRFDAAFAEANGAHVTVTSEQAATLTGIAHDPRVAQASEPVRDLDDATITTGADRTPLLLREVAADSLPSVARPLLREGRWAAAGADDEIVIDRSFALERAVDLGVTVTARSGGGAASYRVVGIAVDLIDCFYPQCDPTTAWVDPAGFARLPTGTASHTIFLRLHDPRAVDPFVTDILGRFPDAGTNDWLDTRADVLAVNGVFSAFLALFGVFVLLAAMFVVAASMATRTMARRREIGLLKAVGCTPGQVTAFVVVFHAAVGAVGAAVGWIVGSLMAGPLQLRLAEVLGSGPVAFRVRDLAIVLVAVEVLVLAATVGAAWRAGRLPTTSVLSGAPLRGRARRRHPRPRHSLLGHPVLSGAVRQATARPGRAVATIAAAMVAVVAAVVTLGFDHTVDRALDDPAVTGNPFDVVVEPGGEPVAQVADGLRRVPGVVAVVGASDRRVLRGGDAFLGRALDGDVAAAGYRVREGRTIAGPDEAMVGYGLMTRLGLHVGERLDVQVGGGSLSLLIVGWYAETEDTGEVLLFPMAALRSIDRAAAPDRLLVRAGDGTTATQLTAAVQRALPNADARPAVVEPEDELHAFRVAFYLVTGLLVVVAFVNLATTVLLVQRESRRDGALRRAVGFTPGQALSVAGLGAALLAATAAVLGSALGWVVYRMLMGGLSRGIGVGPGFGADPSAADLAVLVPATIVVGLALGLATAARGALRPVVAALHDE